MPVKWHVSQAQLLGFAFMKLRAGSMTIHSFTGPRQRGHTSFGCTLFSQEMVSAGKNPTSDRSSGGTVTIDTELTTEGEFMVLSLLSCGCVVVGVVSANDLRN